MNAYENNITYIMSDKPTDEAIKRLNTGYTEHMKKLATFISNRKTELTNIRDNLKTVQDELDTVQRDLTNKISSHVASNGELQAEIDILKSTGGDLTKKLEQATAMLQKSTDVVDNEVDQFRRFEGTPIGTEINHYLTSGGKRMKRRSRRFSRERKSRRK